MAGDAVTSGNSATLRGRRAIEVLTQAGQRVGYRVETEFPVQGGRIDVVWLTDLPAVFDTDSLVIAAFEVESSWRTRKHLKGDYLNLFDVGAAVGVVVLLGEGADVDSTAVFAELLVQRPGPRILVWRDEDIDRVATALVGDDRSEEQAVPAQASASVEAATDAALRHVGKYRSLWQWLASQTGDELSLTFDEVEEVIGMPLPTSCRRYPAHWYSYEGSAVARAIQDAGWRASNVSLDNQRLTLRRATRPEFH